MLLQETKLGPLLARSIAMKQPPELLQNIIERLIIPDTILPYTKRPLIQPGGHPRAKVLPLIYLCKACCLSTTLQKVEYSGLRAWVESIEIWDMLAAEIASSIFQAEIQILLKVCRNLTKFACMQVEAGIFFTPCAPMAHRPHHPHPPPTCLFPSGAHSGSEGNVPHLTFTVYIARGRVEVSRVVPCTTFDAPVAHTRHTAKPKRTGMCETWHMPNLTRLLLWKSPEYDSNPSNLYSIYDENSGLEDFKTGSLATSHSFSKPISHLKLQWIDIWAANVINRTVGSLKQLIYGFQLSSSQRSPGESGMPYLPSIRGVRILPQYLREVGHLPYILAPTSDSTEPQVVHSSPSLGASSSWHRWLMEDYPEEGSDDDSDYIEDSEDDEGTDTETDTESDLSDDGEDWDRKGPTLLTCIENLGFFVTRVEGSLSTEVLKFYGSSFDGHLMCGSIE